MSANKRDNRTMNAGSRQAGAATEGKTPRELQDEVESIPENEVADDEALDDPADKTVRPVEPRCRKCGATFSIEAELMEHAKTCKGGHDPGVQPRFH